MKMLETSKELPNVTFLSILFFDKILTHRGWFIVDFVSVFPF